jgi:hypothetical protein
MRLIQHLMLAQSDLSHLAEVFLSGLLHRLGDPNEDPNTAQYEFVPGIRALLNDHLSRDELLQVLQRSSQFVTAQFGQAFDFAAVVADPEGAELPAVAGHDDTSRPLAVVSAEVLARLGGRYQVLAQRISAQPNLAEVQGSAATATPSPTITEEAFEAAPVSEVHPTASTAHDARAPVPPKPATPAVFPHPHFGVGHFLAVTASTVAGEEDRRGTLAVAHTIGNLLDPHYTSEYLDAPTHAEIADALERLPSRLQRSAPLVVFWSAPIVASSDGQSRLLGRDDRAPWTSAPTIRDLVHACMASGAEQILMLLDGGSASLRELELEPWTNQWVAIVGISSDGRSTFSDLIGSATTRLSAEWPPHLSAVTGQRFMRDLARHVNALGTYSVSTTESGTPRPMMRNPAFRATADPPQAAYRTVQDKLAEQDLKGAEHTGRAIPEDELRSRSLRDVAIAYAEADDVRNAVRVSADIENPAYRAESLVAIAGAHARTSRPDWAEAVLGDARNLLDVVSDPTARADIQRAIDGAASAISSSQPGRARWRRRSPPDVSGSRPINTDNVPLYESGSSTSPGSEE